MGLSREVKAIVAFVEATGLPHRVTSTTGGTHAEKSRHYQAGTDGEGLAVDLAGPTPGDTKAMLAIYRALLPQHARLHELIFWAPSVDTLVRRKLRVVPMTYGQAVLDVHRSHVHVSVDKGTFLVPPALTRPPGGAQGPVHDWEAPVKTTMLTIPLDDKGCGWADFDPALGRDPIPVAVMKQGPNPSVDGYWPEYAAMDLSAQPRDGKLRVTARGGPPGGKAVCWITAA